MTAVTGDAWRDFVLSTPRIAKLASVRAGGSPHLAPIWIDLDGDTIVFTTMATTVKARNVRRDSRVALCVDDDAFPYAFVIIEGTAAIEELSLEQLRYWTTRIAGRYMGAERAEEFGRRNAVPGELLVRVTPTRVTLQPW